MATKQKSIGRWYFELLEKSESSGNNLLDSLLMSVRCSICNNEHKIKPILFSNQESNQNSPKSHFGFKFEACSEEEIEKHFNRIDSVIV